jgi:hypothetical protein
VNVVAHERSQPQVEHLRIFAAQLASPIENPLDFFTRKVNVCLFIEFIEPIQPVFTIGIERTTEIEQDGLTICKGLRIHRHKRLEISL